MQISTDTERCVVEYSLSAQYPQNILCKNTYISIKSNVVQAV